MGTPARTLLLAAVLLAAGRAEAYLVPGMEADLLAIVKGLEDGKDVRKKVAEFRKKYDEYDEVSRAYKPRMRGGVGVGPPMRADGIETRIMQLARKAMTAEQLKAEKAALLRMAHVHLAVAVLTPAYALTKKVKEWHGSSGEMAAEARGLIAAIKTGDPDAVKKAATRVNNNCNSCHETHRDN